MAPLAQRVINPTAMQAIAHHWPWFWPVVVGVLGAVVGSLATCLRYRLPRGLPLRSPPSACPACGTVLGVVDLIPVLSWLALRGRCRHCGVGIPWQSLVLEVGFIAYAQVAYLMVGPSAVLWPILAGWLALGVGMVCGAQSLIQRLIQRR